RVRYFRGRLEATARLSEWVCWSFATLGETPTYTLANGGGDFSDLARCNGLGQSHCCRECRSLCQRRVLGSEPATKRPLCRNELWRGSGNSFEHSPRRRRLGHRYCDGVSCGSRETTHIAPIRRLRWYADSRSDRDWR